MKVAEAAARSGLPAKTLRYYEEIGLITPRRRDNGYRDYEDGDVNRLRFLRRARQMGFSIADCRQLLSLFDDQDRESADVKSIAVRHLAHIDARIEEMNLLRRNLARLVEACHGDGRADCPILDDLSGRPGCGCEPEET
ncbi:MAG: Cu(I)-responsive transcriptional regulator [Hyphomicrobiales bacterium]|nr:MAG: Cu(I)-responsive transcriptional regulator [Hyphomicrobiales bacterium]